MVSRVRRERIQVLTLTGETALNLGSWIALFTRRIARRFIAAIQNPPKPDTAEPMLRAE